MLAFIKSQNAEVIVPFNKIFFIEVEKDNKAKILCNDESYVYKIILGTYKDIERAKYILQEILDWYDDLMSQVASNSVYKIFYYQMPEE